MTFGVLPTEKTLGLRFTAYQSFSGNHKKTCAHMWHAALSLARPLCHRGDSACIKAVAVPNILLQLGHIIDVGQRNLQTVELFWLTKACYSVGQLEARTVSCRHVMINQQSDRNVCHVWF